jgi:hypothetical protein
MSREFPIYLIIKNLNLMATLGGNIFDRVHKSVSMLDKLIADMEIRLGKDISHSPFLGDQKPVVKIAVAPKVEPKKEE